MYRIITGKVNCMNEYIVTINNHKRHIKIIDDESLLIDGKKINFELHKLSNGISVLKIDNKLYELSSEIYNNEHLRLFINGKHIETLCRTSLEERASELLEKADALHPNKVTINAPMPGMILKIRKNSGEKIKIGEPVMILEAMKMENEIKSPVSGIIADMNVEEGSAVEKNTILFSIE